MKKMQAPKPIASMGLSNTAAVVISEIDNAGENVKYYVTTTGAAGLVDVHTAKLHYRKDGTPYFDSIAGRLLLSDFIRI